MPLFHQATPSIFPDKTVASGSTQLTIKRFRLTSTCKVARRDLQELSTYIPPNLNSVMNKAVRRSEVVVGIGTFVDVLA